IAEIHQEELQLLIDYDEIRVTVRIEISRRAVIWKPCAAGESQRGRRVEGAISASSERSDIGVEQVGHSSVHPPVPVPVSSRERHWIAESRDGRSERVSEVPVSEAGEDGYGRAEAAGCGICDRNIQAAVQIEVGDHRRVR